MEQQSAEKLEFDVHITESLLMRVSMKRIFHRWPLKLVAIALILISTFVGQKEGEISPISIAGLTSLGILILVYVAYFIKQRRSIADWLKKQGDDPVHYTIDQNSLRASSNLGASELKWHVFTELLEHPDYLLLKMGRSGHLTLPRSDVPEEAEKFIRQRFAELKLLVKKA